MHDPNARGLDLRGALTAIVTPFEPEGSVDHAALERLARWQVEQGIHGLVPCGTTGCPTTASDSYSLS